MTADNDTSGRVWFVTGATRGLGLAVAAAALDAGENVVATGRDAATIEAALRGHGGRLLALHLDVTDQTAIDIAVKRAIAHFGRIDVLVNNAGYGQLGAFEEISPDAVERQFATNVFGVFAVTRAVLPGMRQRRSGRIINISSMVGLVGVAGGSIYCASKFAVTGWSEALGKELAHFGIDVTSVHPGYFRTGFLGADSMREGDTEIGDYAEASNTAAQRRASYNGSQAGDPAAFGRAMLELANSANPPAAFLAGDDAVNMVLASSDSLRSSISDWKALSTSTGFPGDG